MTSLEHEPPHERQRPRHRRSEAEEDIALHFRSRPGWRDDEFIARAIQSNPEALAAYLQLPDVDPNSTSLFEDFGDIFFSQYDSLDEAIDDQIESLGWNDALTALQRDCGVTPDELQWNYAAIERRFRETVDVIYYRDKIYIFHQ